MKDPVLLKTGQTYEKETIIHSFESAGNFDPVTR